MHIVHVVAGIWRHTGGPAEVVPQLCSSLVEQGCRVTLLSLDGPHSDATLECAKKGVDFRSYPVIGRRGIWYSPKLSRNLNQLAKEADIIHDHGLWLYPNWQATKFSARWKKPLVITPHGVLTRGMLKYSRVKKAIAWTTFDKKSIKYASIIQAFTKTELGQMKGRLGGKKIAIIPNGVDIWNLPDRSTIIKKYPYMKDRKILLFLARVNPVKGILDLLDSWKILNKRWTDWHLLIVGKSEGACIKKVPEKIKGYNLQSHITLTGPLYGNDRLEAYALADAFVLPSYAEGFPTSLLEAMACKLPVIYTPPCNFPEAAQRGAGIEISKGSDSLIKSLEKLFLLSDSERTKMGLCGYNLIREKYTWHQVSKKMKRTYEWLLGEGKSPPWVDII